MPVNDVTIENFRRRIAEAQQRLTPYESGGVTSFDKDAQGHCVENRG